MFKFAIISVIFGFLIGYIFNYSPHKKHGKKLRYRQEFDLFIGKYCYHIHHWITLSVLLIVLNLGKYDMDGVLFNFTEWFILGLILEGFLFKDAFKIKNNCNISGK